mmetsp:Transcript_6881/g.6136  ORF Transcript_6881/g.6136 Transcript_6881/m.6136 type:complete len:196 (-) Transcript_6881:183-770(-)
MMKLLVTVLFVSIFNVNVNGVTCSGNCDCGGTDPCTLDCGDNGDQCKEANLDCDATVCTVDCTAKAACDNADIDGHTAGTLTIDCSFEDACKTANLDCGDTDCTIRCNGKSACSDAIINAEDATSLTLECNAEDACKGNTVVTCPTGGGSGSCAISCDESSTSCDGTQIIDSNGVCSCSDDSDNGCDGLTGDDCP